MSALKDVLSAIDDFRSALFTIQYSVESRLSAAREKSGLRDAIGNLISPLQNIHATGVGIRRKAGKLLPLEFVIKVYVFQKLAGLSIRLPRILTGPFHGVDIDVEELPILQIRGRKKSAAAPGPRHFQKHRRPIPGGVEIQPHGVNFVGTLGGFVRSVDESAANLFVLSNNHVLAGTNRLAAGTDISQPASNDADHIFARLTSLEAIHLKTPSNPFPSRNRIDAAIARVTDPHLVQTGSIFGIKKYNPVLKSPQPGMKVVKSGRTTAVTRGIVSSTNVNGVLINYGTVLKPVIGTFDECIQISGDNGLPFSAIGDSGALILEKSSGKPTALLVGGNSSATTACDLTAVCTRFRVLPV